MSGHCCSTFPCTTSVARDSETREEPIAVREVRTVRVRHDVEIVPQVLDALQELRAGSVEGSDRLELLFLLGQVGYGCRAED